MAELKPCPKCGRKPLLGYACGEYFIVGQVGGCGVCDMFGEMHASREQEVKAWNRRVKMTLTEMFTLCDSCVYAPCICGNDPDNCVGYTEL